MRCQEEKEMVKAREEEEEEEEAEVSEPDLEEEEEEARDCLLYTSPSPRDKRQSRMPSSA